MQTKFNPKEIDDDYYRAELKKINQQYEKLCFRQMYEVRHEIITGPYDTEYQLYHIGRCRNRLVSFMMEHGIELKKEEEKQNGKL